MNDFENSLLALLDLESVDRGVFRGPPADDGWSRVYGGQVVAQALAAACFTAPEWPCHSLHAAFLRPGKPGRPIDYEVAAMRDGRNLATRNVVAVQRDEVTLQLVASFMREQAGPEYQSEMPQVPAPESYPDEDARIAQLCALAPPSLHDWLRQKRPIEAIRVEPPLFGEGADAEGPSRTWLRARGPLASDPNLHRCVLAYASDMGAIEPCMRAIGADFGDPSLQIASLDHALWFHRDARADDWLLFEFECLAVTAGRGLSRGRVFDRAGRLVASIAQEAFILKQRS